MFNVNYLHNLSLPATFTQSNNNNVANQIQTFHRSLFNFGCKNTHFPRNAQTICYFFTQTSNKMWSRPLTSPPHRFCCHACNAVTLSSIPQLLVGTILQFDNQITELPRADGLPHLADVHTLLDIQVLHILTGKGLV